MAITMISQILTASLCLASAFQEDTVRDAVPVCDMASGQCERESFMQLRAATEMKIEATGTSMPKCREDPDQDDFCGGKTYPTCGFGPELCVDGRVVWTKEAICSNPQGEGTYNIKPNAGPKKFQYGSLPVCEYRGCPSSVPSGGCAEHTPGLECHYDHVCAAGAVASTKATCSLDTQEWLVVAHGVVGAVDAIKNGENYECDCWDTFHQSDATDLFPTDGGRCDVNPSKTCSFSKYCCSGVEKFEKDFKCVGNKWVDQGSGTLFEDATGTCESSNIAGNPTNTPTTGQFIGQCPSGNCPHRSLDIKEGDACFVVNLVHNIEPDVTRHIWMHNTAGFCDFDEHCCNGLHLFFKTYYCHDPDGNGGAWVRAHGQTGASTPTLHADSDGVAVSFTEKSSDLVSSGDGTFQKEIVNNAKGNLDDFTPPPGVVDDIGDECPFKASDEHGVKNVVVFPKPLNDRNHCSCPEDPEAANTDGTGEKDCDVVLPLDLDGKNNHHVGIVGFKTDSSFEARTCTWGRLLCCKDEETGTLDPEPKKEDEGTCTPLDGDAGNPCDDHHGHAQICTGTWTNRIDRTPLVESGVCVVTDDHETECKVVTKEPDYECPTDGEYPEVHTACEGIPNGKCEYDPICCNGEKKWSRIFECRPDNLWYELGQSIDAVQNENTDEPVDRTKLECGFSENNKFTPFDADRGCPGVCPERNPPKLGDKCWLEPFAHNLDPLITRHEVSKQFDEIHRKEHHRDGHCDFDEKCCGDHHIWLKTFWCEDGKWALRERLDHQNSQHDNFELCPDGTKPTDLGRRNHCSCPEKFADTEAGADCDSVLEPATQANLDAHDLKGRTCTWGEKCCENAKEPVPEYQRICEPKPEHLPHLDTCIQNWVGVDATCDAVWQTEHLDNSDCANVKFIPGTHKCYVTSDN